MFSLCDPSDLLIAHPPLPSVERPALGVGKQCVPGITGQRVDIIGVIIL